ncbi:DEAD/DEAH box helicase [Citrobacter freundii]|nr:DEAD/DEAH box helicase [Citrobacter freundii]MBA8033799.1 DEAD/DEAH box helicase [Citrobacter freundii]
MFDPQTTRLILDAPVLDGLKNSDIPKILTESYAQIVAARIRLRENSDDKLSTKDLEENISKLNRLAATHEALVAASRDKSHRESAAFVAASAHHACMLYSKTIAGSTTESQLNSQYISSEISASILYLIAESTSDAHEMTKSFSIINNNSIESALLNSITYLCKGDLEMLLGIEMPTDTIGNLSYTEDGASKALYFLLFHSIRAMAVKIIQPEEDIELLDEDPNVLIKRVLSLSTNNIDILSDKNNIQKSIYSGPYHLATLLMIAYPDLINSSLLNVSPPDGIQHERWVGLLRTIAKKRPYIWKNHQDAIKKGYLNVAYSAAISFPTGAGKSTLSELKIATTLLRNKKVIFLAPTLSLVDQTTRSLQRSFPDHDVFYDANDDTILSELDRLKPISVLTPERCLALLNFKPELFSDIDLMIFDECHLLHPRATDKSRRALDAMLCIINVKNLAKNVRFLFLSAMMKNTEEIAEWLSDITGNTCLSLDLHWKPTRQVRGCVVYNDTEIKKLKQILNDERKVSDNKSAPVKAKNKMLAKPFGLFCLHQTWQSKKRDDYSLIPLLDDNVTLGVGSNLPDGYVDDNKNYRWYTTPNGLKVSAEIAAESAKKKLKTIVFVQTIPNSISTNKYVTNNLKNTLLVLNDDEKNLLSLIKLELGDLSNSYLNVSKDEQSITNGSICHHGHLLSIERNLHESIFSRADGLNVMVATSTLAQGMNLPSDIVIIGGDSRFDIDAQKLDQLEAHELLNAAGRAGRAGERSHGFVLIVPSKVVDFDNKNSRIHNYWAELQSIFAQSDQCLVIEDPLLPILDNIHLNASEETEMSSYLIGRLHFNINQPNTEVSNVEDLLRNSLGAFQARKRSDEEWLKQRISSLRSVYESRPKHIDWHQKLASSTGVPVNIIFELSEMLSGEIRFDATTKDWFEWISNWLYKNPSHLQILIRRETLDNFMGSSYKKILPSDEKSKIATDKIIPLLKCWIEGSSLQELETKYGTKEHLIKTCEKSREFALRIVPEMAYIYSIPSQVYIALCISRGEDPIIPVALDTLGSCVKKGYDKVEKLACETLLKKPTIRRVVHKEFEIIKEYLPSLNSSDSFSTILERVKIAIAMQDF